MTNQVSVLTIPCPDPKCRSGKITVHNAYSPDPLKGEEQDCDRCAGRGFLVIHSGPPSVH